jgi:hypothetical protein
MTTTKNRIENPRIEFKGEHAEYLTAAGCFDFDGARFHIWLNAETGAPKDGVGSTLYKNPPLGLKRADADYYRTRHLDSSKKTNAALLTELFERADFHRARREYIAGLKIKQDARNKEQAESNNLVRLQSLFTVSAAELDIIENNLAGAGGDDVAREIDLIKAIRRYRFPDAH